MKGGKGMKEMHKRSLLVQDFLRLRWLFFVPLAVLFLFLPFSAWQRCEAFRLMGATEPQAVRDGKYILKRIQAAGRPEISKRDLAQVCRGRFPTVEAFEPGLNELVRRGYIRIEKPTGGRGRPAEKVVLNPISISQNTQNTQK